MNLARDLGGVSHAPADEDRQRASATLSAFAGGQDVGQDHSGLVAQPPRARPHIRFSNHPDTGAMRPYTP